MLLVHHCGIDSTRPRGHTSLTGAADAQWAIKRQPDDTIHLFVEWMKDGPDGLELYSRLDTVTVGLDEDGIEITSCVITAVDKPTIEHGDQLTKNQASMFSILRGAMPGGLIMDAWNQQARTNGLGLRRRTDLLDLRTALKTKGLVYEHGGKWFAKV